jgi:uncharacterized protein (TIGR02246 family)
MAFSPRARSSLLAAVLGLAAVSTAQAQGIESPRVPLRTALAEINTLRAEYAAAYNRHDAAAVTAMYLPDAVLIRPDGSTLLGRPSIGKAMTEESAKWAPSTLSSDTVRVYGNTAWDVGTMSATGADGASTVHYLVVLRRGLEGWKISSLAVVPETPVTAAR